MSDYRPTTEEVFDAATHLFVASLGYRTLTIAELDRWLAEVKAQAWDEGFDAGIDHTILKEFVFNPYSIKSEHAQKYIKKRFSEDTE